MHPVRKGPLLSRDGGPRDERLVAIPGDFKSFGHDYRAETLTFVGAVYDLPEITGDQSRLVRTTLVRWELDRARRIEPGEMDEIRISQEKMRGSIQ